MEMMEMKTELYVQINIEDALYVIQPYVTL